MGPQLFKDPGCWSGRGLNLPTKQPVGGYGLPVKWWTCVLQLYRRQLPGSQHLHKIVVLSVLGRLVET